jgi:hypothetical protein
MLKRSIVAFILICSNLLFSQLTVAQAGVKTENKSNPPFRLLTSGKKITVQAKQNIQSVIVWTASGHRVIEQKDINSTAFSFDITINAKIFFVRVDMADGTMHTKRIGLQ